MGLSPEAPRKETTVTQIGLTLDEHFDLRVKPRSGADPAFHEAALRRNRTDVVNDDPGAASHHLRSRAHGFHTAILGAMV